LDRQEIRASAGGTVLETRDNDYIQTGTYGSTYVPTTVRLSAQGTRVS
jgi:hypothetical protein